MAVGVGLVTTALAAAELPGLVGMIAWVTIAFARLPLVLLRGGHQLAPRTSQATASTADSANPRGTLRARNSDPRRVSRHRSRSTSAALWRRMVWPMTASRKPPRRIGPTQCGLPWPALRRAPIRSTSRASSSYSTRRTTPSPARCSSTSLLTPWSWVRPALLGEVIWWHTNDLFVWSLYALVIYTCVAAERMGESVAAMCERIAARHVVHLDAA